MFIPTLEPPRRQDGSAVLLMVGPAGVAVRSGPPPPEAVFVGMLGGLPCWAVELDDESEADPEARDLRSLWSEVDHGTWTAAGRAVQLVEWARTHRYCGRCGSPTEDVSGLRAKRCPRCGMEAFPRLSPAVICLVERDDGTALLARGPQFTAGMFSCLAGFVEPGETLEEAVAREVHEEVAIEIGDIRYSASQPWPFPHSLMIGFTARWIAGEIEVDGIEITDAAWFAPSELPDLPSPISIARHLIDDWRARSSRPILS